MEISYHDVKIGMNLILDSHKCVVVRLTDHNPGKAGYPRKIVYGKDIVTGKEYMDVLRNLGCDEPMILKSF